MDEKYDLKWKTFNDHLVEVFRNLGEEGHFADVTLVSDDQIQTKAHKVVLSACSPVLKTLLVNNPHSHPLLYLRGVNQSELKSILKFMYYGETQIFEARINEFVNLAKDLEIKEISKEQNIEETQTEHEAENYSKEKNNTSNEYTSEPNSEEHSSVKIEDQFVNTERTIAKPQQGLVKQRKSKKKGERRSCEECDKSFSDQKSLRTHQKNKHEGVLYHCTITNFDLN